MAKSRKPTGPSTETVKNPEVDSEALIKECEDALEKLLDQQPEAGESFEAYERAVLKAVHEIARRKLEKKNSRWLTDLRIASRSITRPTGTSTR